MQGVLLNMFGRGILMKGDSGIGKTTLAMKLVQRGHVWVADDAIEIEKKDSHHLYARGHDRSRHLVDMKALGPGVLFNTVIYWMKPFFIWSSNMRKNMMCVHAVL